MQYMQTDVYFSHYKPHLAFWQCLANYRYNDIIMDAMASQITSLAMVHSTVYSGADPRKHQSSASLAFVWGNPRTNDQ